MQLTLHIAIIKDLDPESSLQRVIRARHLPVSALSSSHLVSPGLIKLLSCCCQVLISWPVRGRILCSDWCTLPILYSDWSVSLCWQRNEATHWPQLTTVSSHCQCLPELSVIININITWNNVSVSCQFTIVLWYMSCFTLIGSILGSRLRLSDNTFQSSISVNITWKRSART